MSAELLAVGVEVVSVPRFQGLLDRHGPRLLERLFSPDELAYARRKRNASHNLAARLAAKCAGRRALRGSLGGGPIALRELEVVRRRSGEPRLAWRRQGAGDDLRLLVSLTHDPDFAMACVWVERAGPEARGAP